MIRILLLVVMMAGWVHVVEGQKCTENVLDGFNVEFGYGGSGGGSIGQTFTACMDGAVTSITIHEGALSTGGPYSLWIAPEAGGGNTGYTAVAPHATVADPGGAFPRITKLVVTPPFPVTAGSVYRFVLNKAGIIHIRCTNAPAPADYAGGLATDDSGTYGTFDLDFEVRIAAQGCTSNVLDGFNVEFGYGGSGGGSIGQTFTACGDGSVTSITIHEGAASTGGPYSLWIAPEAGGGNTGYTAVAPYATVADPGGAFPRITTLVVTPPFPVTAGSVYRFVLNNAGIIHIRCTNAPAPADYAGGLATDDSGTYGDFDLDFEVGIGGPRVCAENVLDGFNVEFGYGGSGGGSIGQTFTACGNGSVSSITIHEGASSTGGPYSLWIAPEAGGGNTGYTAVVPYATVADPGGAFPRITTLVVTPPFPVTGNSTYRFVLNNAGIIHIRCTNAPAPADYARGLATDDAGTYGTYDLDFQVRIDQPIGTVDVPASRVPHQLSFDPTWPNPAQRETRLDFALPRETKITLSIYDVGGRRARSMIDGVMDAGEHSLRWDLTDDGGRLVHPGLYFVNLSVEGQTHTRRVIVVP